MSEFQTPDSSYFGQKAITVPTSEGNVDLILGPNSNSGLSSVALIPASEFDAMLEEKFQNVEMFRKPSKLLSDYRLSKQAEEGAICMPSFFSSDLSQRFSPYAQNDERLLSEKPSCRLFNMEVVDFLREKGAEFYPIVINGNEDFCIKTAEYIGAIDSPILSKDLTVQGEDCSAVLPTDGVIFTFPIDEVAERTAISSQCDYLINIDSIDEQIEALTKHYNAGGNNRSKESYDWDLRRLQDERQQKEDMYSGFVESHVLLCILAAAGVKTVELQKYYEGDFTRSDLAVQVDLVKADLDISNIQDPIEMVSRYEWLLSFNLHEQDTEYQTSMIINQGQDEARHEFRRRLASEIKSNPDALTIAESELEPVQLEQFFKDLELEPVVALDSQCHHT